MSGERILIVDDGKENRDFIVEYVLRPNGFEALVARDGVEGMEMARQYHPDLILLDLQMPRMNGLEVIDALNAEQLNIPVILMTFHGSEEIAIEVYRKGVRDYVKKPYTVEEMYEAIDRSLAIVRLRKEKDQLTDRLLEANAAMHQRVRELNVLYNVGKVLTNLNDLNTIFSKLAEATSQITSSEESSLFLLSGEQLACRAIHRQAEQRTYLLDELRPDPLVARAIQTQQPVVMTPEELQQARQYNPSAPTAAMAAPIMLSNQPIGALLVRNVSAGARLFTRNDGALLSALSDYAAMSIAYAQASQTIATTQVQRGDREEVIRWAVATQVLQQVDPTDLESGLRRDVSVIGLKIQGHAAFIKKAPPEQIVKVLNEYLGIATQVVFEQQGTITDLTADSLTVMFNAPSTQADYLTRTARTALLIKQRVAEANKKRGGGLTFGIGLALGEGVLGYFGVQRTLSYTAVGDVVNIAQHLQVAAKAAQILLTENLAQHIQGLAHLQPVGKLPYRGWQDGIMVYELLDLRG